MPHETRTQTNTKHNCHILLMNELFAFIHGNKKTQEIWSYNTSKIGAKKIKYQNIKIYCMTQSEYNL